MTRGFDRFIGRGLTITTEKCSIALTIADVCEERDGSFIEIVFDGDQVPVWLTPGEMRMLWDNGMMSFGNDVIVLDKRVEKV